MRLIQLVLTGLLFVLTPFTGFSAGGSVSVRAIAFVASNERGATDPRLAPYESMLRGKTRFESFKYLGENSASVPPGGSATIQVQGGSVEVRSDPSGNMTVTHRESGTSTPLSRGTVFMVGQTKSGVSGIIVTSH